MPPISKMIESKYIKTGDIEADGEDGQLDLTIADIRPEDLKVDGGETKKKWVCYFEEVERGLVLNTTNTKKLAEVCGSELSENWPGNRVRLYVTPVQFRGDQVNAIRIKAARPSRQAQSPGDRAPSPDDNASVTAATNEIPF